MPTRAFLLVIWLVLLASCSQQYYAPGNLGPISLEARGEGIANLNLGLLGPFPIRSADLQLGYSPLDHLAIVAGGTYYHPLFDGERRLWGDVGVGTYRKLSESLDFQVYGFVGRLGNYYRPDYTPFAENGPESLTGSADLRFTRYLLWPTLRLRDKAGMSLEVGLRLNRLGLTSAELTAPLNDFQIDRIRALGQATPFHFAELTGSFVLSRSERHRLVITLLRTTSSSHPLYLPRGSYTINMGYSHRFGGG